ncbi:TonB-dependent receptor [Thalassotalea sp. HSM 43]|uniref:TonB-dependent receptor domain-containing protein n=1 Tax=Thalassotalea sp. HSM 43 TaxID=2552945 RepID=UPI001081A1B8|nr:TonB-dependent receptor [Thalassotalea sp. HSM 43]QBY03002.1 TonB-dependent receptor [Thalassotalea sp. HSM 43]
MNNNTNATKGAFRLSSLSLALVAAMTANTALAQESDIEDEAIEEVVVKASRLKGTATAVLQERKNQAFVADILGAEQIARTGDSDAAAALKRVTGLTLVDGKFIYVRGLGERYSSTLLNGAQVPSPDPTRTVIPLDLFPSSIVESLSVQKSYSASMPAHFGGGNVDIRIKTIPSDFTLQVGANIGGNTDNFGEGFEYNGGDDDWYGRDDGTRGAPSSLKSVWNNYDRLQDLTQQENRQIAADLNRDYDPVQQNVDPDFGVDFTIGDRFDSDNGDWRYGYLAAVSYDNEYQFKEEFEGQDFTNNGDGSYKMIRGFDDIQTTEHTVKWSGMFNFGVEYNRDHRIDLSTMILNDTIDETSIKLGNSNNVLISDGLRIRDNETIYEERELIANQVRGTHNFPELMYLGLDWFYSDSRSNRYAPGNVSTRFILFDANNDGEFDLENESNLRRGTTASRYTFQDLNDDVENSGFNVSLPLTWDKSEIELKAGGNFVEKARDAFARRVDVNTLAFDELDMSGDKINDILTDDVMLNWPLVGNQQIIRDTTVDGDDYYSGQKIDAWYGEVDWFYDNTWRVAAGIRWEDYRQVVAPLKTDGSFDLPEEPTAEDLEELTRKEEDYFPALALTYVMDDSVQFRVSYGETVVRPDIREIAPATYLDPLTGQPIGGTPGVRSTEIKNYDARWEWYLDTGENLSVGLFYKDMIDPIESIQSPAQDGPALIRIANAEEGEVYGIEAEFLKDFTFLGGYGQDFFLSGNVTISDSEVTIDTQKVVEQTGVSAAITNTERRLTGHSEYVVNLNLGWDAPNGNHSATLAYNVFGERIIFPGIEGEDDKFEQPFHSVDLVYTYYPTYSSTLKFKVNNVLDEKKEIEFDDQLYRSSTQGIGFDISFKWDFE